MRRLLTTDRVAPLGLFLFVFSVAIRPTVDNDLWWHLASGRWMLEHHAVIGPDPFSHTQLGVSRIAVDWLGQVIFFGVWSSGGLTSVSLLVASLAVVGVVFVYRACRGALVVRVPVIALATMTSSIFWSDRPQMFSFALSSISVWLLVTWRRDPTRRSIWWIVPLFALWANLHGAVVYGALLVWGTVIGMVVNTVVNRDDVDTRVTRRSSVRTIVLVAIGSLMAMMVNPSGWLVFVAPLRQLRANLPLIEEFQPPAPSDTATWPFFLMAAAALGSLLLVGWKARPAARFGWRSVDATDWLLVMGTLMLAVRVTRAIGLFAVVAAPVIADGLRVLVETRASARESEPGDFMASREASPVILAIILVVLVIGSALGVHARLDRAEDDAVRSYPRVAALLIATDSAKAHLFNEYLWGGYLEWQAPGALVSIDSRNDLFGDQIDTYLATIRAEGDWAGELDREKVDTVVIAPQTALAQALRRERSWSVAYEDVESIVFQRITPAR